MRKDDFTLPKSEIFTVGKSKVAALMSEVGSSADIFDEDGLLSVRNVPDTAGSIGTFRLVAMTSCRLK